MNEKKKLNLLPPEAKNRYANKYLKITASVIAGFFVLLLLAQYGRMGLLNMQIDRIMAENKRYNDQKENIIFLKENIEKCETFLNDFESDCFPFSLFMYDIEAQRPSDVYIISVDSSERLINEGAQEEEDKKDGSKKETTKDETPKEEASKEETDDTKNETEAKETNPKIEYTEDLSGREIVIRGFGRNQESISNFIYDITHLPYLSNAEITAIEEHKIEDGIYNIFEIKLTGGVYR